MSLLKTQTLKIQGQDTNMRVGYLTEENLPFCHYIPWKKGRKRNIFDYKHQTLQSKKKTTPE